MKNGKTYENTFHYDWKLNCTRQVEIEMKSKRNEMKWVEMEPTEHTGHQMAII